MYFDRVYIWPFPDRISLWKDESCGYPEDGKRQRRLHQRTSDTRSEGRVCTFLGDSFKCIFAVLAVRLIFGGNYGEILPLLSIYAGLGAVLGHNFPFYLGFKGGKGIAAMAGLLAALTNLWITLIALVVFVTIVAVTKYVSVGSIAVVLIFFAGVVFRGQTGSYGMESVYLYEMYAVAGFLALLAIWKHRANIQRLMNGTENKISFGKKK